MNVEEKISPFGRNDRGEVEMTGGSGIGGVGIEIASLRSQ